MQLKPSSSNGEKRQKSVTSQASATVVLCARHRSFLYDTLAIMAYQDEYHLHWNDKLYLLETLEEKCGHQNQ